MSDRIQTAAGRQRIKEETMPPSGNREGTSVPGHAHARDLALAHLLEAEKKRAGGTMTGGQRKGVASRAPL
jgi:hypothetical protein